MKRLLRWWLGINRNVETLADADELIQMQIDELKAKVEAIELKLIPPTKTPQAKTPFHSGSFTSSKARKELEWRTSPEYKAIQDELKERKAMQPKEMA